MTHQPHYHQNVIEECDDKYKALSYGKYFMTSNIHFIHREKKRNKVM